MKARDRRREMLLDELRRLHRAEPAPPELRRWLLARAERDADGPGALRRALRPVPLGAREGLLAAAARPRFALGALALLALLAFGFALRSTSNGGLGGEVGSRAASPELALGPEPRAGASGGQPPAARRGAGEDRAPFDDAAEADELTAAMAERARPCPLAAIPRGAVLMPQHSGLPGFTAHTFEQMTPSCGPITRRYLELVPSGLARRSSAPVVILLHDAGEAAETLHSQKSGLNFEDLARRNAIVLIYANAAPGLATSVGLADSGAWQTDPRTHGEVDDEEYLLRIVTDLGARDIIGGSNDVFLVGYGDGAAMALDAAVRSSGVFAGVAAFAPSDPTLAAPARPRASGRLSRVMLVLEVPPRGTADAWFSTMPVLAQRWAAVLGLEPKVVGRKWNFGDPKKPTGSLAQFDVSLPATGSFGVRVYITEGIVEAPPNAFQAWDFLTGVDGADASAPDDSPELPLEDAFDEDEARTVRPSVMMGEDAVTAPPPGQRPAP
jgi:poly(3-hydroxybutyrate) depolymerase